MTRLKEIELSRKVGLIDVKAVLTGQASTSGHDIVVG
jgi:hypothetical protein